MKFKSGEWIKIAPHVWRCPDRGIAISGRIVVMGDRTWSTNHQDHYRHYQKCCAIAGNPRRGMMLFALQVTEIRND